MSYFLQKGDETADLDAETESANYVQNLDKSAEDEPALRVVDDVPNNKYDSRYDEHFLVTFLKKVLLDQAIL